MSVCALSAAGEGGTPPCATPEQLAQLSGTIVYEGDPIAGPDPVRDFDIWAMGAPHWKTVLIAGGRGFDGHPNWSPEGDRIVYSAHGGGNADLYLINPANGDRERLTDAEGRDDYPRWLRDGITYRNGNVQYLINSSTRERKPYEKLAGIENFTVSPDGKRMVVSKTAPIHPLACHLYLTDEQGDPIRQLTNAFAVETHPFWSPLDNRIVYSGGDGTRNGKWDVFILNLDTDTTARVTQNPGADWACGWSPDGQWLLIASEYNDNWDVYVIRPDGSDRLRITCHEGNARYAHWTAAEFPSLGVK